ncbi:regulatory protein RecX [Arcticibacter sp. MXS-1]|uniref:regulatory protein RecX n=1 Tax=Arcticibacter sp. MXS-1 TaxID=3341726 RepID=UPI0035A8F511
MNTEKKAARPIDPKTALTKAESYCAYQERSQQEVRDKLYAFGLHSRDVEEIISNLIQNNFLNEERFATAYALGKFRMKQWGKLKIKAGLKSKRVSAALISKALKQIDQEEYYATLESVIRKKEAGLKEKNALLKKQKLAQFVAGRGFESDLIFEILNTSDLI